ILRVIAFVPLAILLLERLWIPFEGPASGYLQHVQDVAASTTVKNKKSVVGKQSAATLSLQNFPDEYPLQRITQNYRLLRDYSCPKGTEKVSNKITPLPIGNAKEDDNNIAMNPRSIPNIIHIAVDNKCVAPQLLYDRIEQWKMMKGWSVYIHDEEAMTRLLKFPEISTEFPQLPQIVRNCVLSPHQHDDSAAALQTLWKYLVLYIYGGVYTSMELVPTPQFSYETLHDKDAIVALPPTTETDESTKFIMAPPRHPLLFYALHHALQGMVGNGSDGGDEDDELVKALRDFRGQQESAISVGTYPGVDKSHSVTMIDLNGNRVYDMVKHGEGNVVVEKKTQQQATVSCDEKILMEVLQVAKERQ
ncbi:MAG: hypothetical protein SGILL_004209, partial [Bacillariaceae sp.]